MDGTTVEEKERRNVRNIKIAGLDIGTTGCKLTVFDSTGKKLDQGPSCGSGPEIYQRG